MDLLLEAGAQLGDLLDRGAEDVDGVARLVGQSAGRGELMLLASVEFGDAPVGGAAQLQQSVQREA